MKIIKVVAIFLLLLILLSSCSDTDSGMYLEQCCQAYNEIRTAQSLHFSIDTSYNSEDDRASQYYESYISGSDWYYDNSGIFDDVRYVQWANKKYIHTEKTGKWVEVSGSQSVNSVFTSEWEKINFTYVDHSDEKDQTCVELKAVDENKNEAIWEFFLDKDGRLTYLKVTAQGATLSFGDETSEIVVDIISEYTFYDDSPSDIQQKIHEFFKVAESEAKSNAD